MKPRLMSTSVPTRVPPRPPALGSLLENLKPGAAEEEFTELFTRPGLRIERIVSTGQSSPDGFWYDQPYTEWVLVVAGGARLRFEGEADARELKSGDYAEIPPHCRHRLDWTEAEPPTVWLAIHIAGE